MSLLREKFDYAKETKIGGEGNATWIYVGIAGAPALVWFIVNYVQTFSNTDAAAATTAGLNALLAIFALAAIVLLRVPGGKLRAVTAGGFLGVTVLIQVFWLLFNEGTFSWLTETSDGWVLLAGELQLLFLIAAELIAGKPKSQ